MIGSHSYLNHQGQHWDNLWAIQRPIVAKSYNAMARSNKAAAQKLDPRILVYQRPSLLSSKSLIKSHTDLHRQGTLARKKWHTGWLGHLSSAPGLDHRKGRAWGNRNARFILAQSICRLRLLVWIDVSNMSINCAFGTPQVIATPVSPATYHLCQARS